MNQEINKKAIDRIFLEICNHKEFANSPTYKRLLEYLIEKSLAGENLKEYTIGSDLYGIDYGVDKSNGTVRSYMYKLRKKLASYYADSGMQHSVIFEIKKGQYNLHFITKKEFRKHKSSPTITIPTKYLWFAAAFLLLLFLAFLGKQIHSNQTPSLWKNFIKKGATNLVIFSDNYVVSEINQYNERHAILYGEINSDEEFFQYEKNHPERRLNTTDYTLLTKMAPFSAQTLSRWFMENNSWFDLRLESQLTLDEIKENNTVFVGQNKTMNISRSLFLKDSKVFTTYKDGYAFKTPDLEKNYTTKHHLKGKVEYAMVSYTSLNSGTNAFYFVSNNDIGVMATLRLFTNKKWLKEFSKKLPEKDSKFNALFEVSGVLRTDMSCELVELEVLE